MSVLRPDTSENKAPSLTTATLYRDASPGGEPPQGHDPSLSGLARVPGVVGVVGVVRVLEPRRQSLVPVVLQLLPLLVVVGQVVQG